MCRRKKDEITYQIFLLPHFNTDAARRFCNLSEDILSFLFYFLILKSSFLLQLSNVFVKLFNDTKMAKDLGAIVYCVDYL